MVFNNKAVNVGQMAAITEQLRSRGPDGSGVLQFDHIILGQRRLKIFDLSPKGQQPMFDPTLGIGVVFNGAIYNFRQLRDRLVDEGYSFFSSSDTEVLLKAYHAWGEGMLTELQGMFAFAIWERDSGRIFLARDRLGIKPLYYTSTSDYFRFSSTLPSLLGSMKDKTVSPEGLHYYLTFHAVPEPGTIIKGIHKLEPGTFMVVNPDGTTEKKRYWDVCFNELFVYSKLSEEEWIDALHAKLTESVKRRLTGDVPVGVLLSGGLDSSLLVGLLADSNNHLPQTFSIGFESTPEEEGNEFYYSDQVVERYNTQHHKIHVKTPDMINAVNDCVRVMSEPMTNHDNVAFYLLSREVSKSVKVVQSGQGADEIFAGYHWFQKVAEKSGANEEAAAIISENLSDRSYKEYAQAVTPKFLVPDHAYEFLKELCSRNGSTRVFDGTMKYETSFALANGPLARVDNMTMAWGLEARVPFLDHEVVELASKMPLSLKIREGGKYILKKLARRFLPSDIIDRPKGYFPVPALKYMGTKEQQWIRDILSPTSLKRRGLFNPSYIEMLFKEPKKHRTPIGASKLWQMAVLELWLQANHIG